MTTTVEPAVKAAVKFDPYKLHELGRAQLEAVITEVTAELETEWEHLDHASDQAHTAWAKVEKSSGKSGRLRDVDPTILEAANAATKRWETVNRRIHRAEVAIAQAKRRLVELDDPVVQERIETSRARLAVLRSAPRETARDQGVPDVYLAESGNFKPGYDAKYKSDLVNSVLGEPTKLVQFEADDALERLQQRDWVKYLAAARARRGQK